jgi:hypothetical protein
VSERYCSRFEGSIPLGNAPAFPLSIDTLKVFV